MERLRLFPLRMVLFPGMPLTLQVFEERYRTLVAECLRADEPFGVALIREGEEVGGPATPYSLGTTAAIRRVTPTRDGRLVVEAEGVRRFRIRQSSYDEPYLSAAVEYPVDEASPYAASLLEETRERYQQLQRLRHTIASEYHRRVEAPATPGALADAIGAAGRGIVGDRRLQRLLETLPVGRRLDGAAELAVDVLAAVHQQAQAVVAHRWAAVERRN